LTKTTRRSRPNVATQYVRVSPKGADTSHARFSACDYGKVLCAEPSLCVSRACSSVSQSLSFASSVAKSLFWRDESWESIISTATTSLTSRRLSTHLEYHRGVQIKTRLILPVVVLEWKHTHNRIIIFYSWSIFCRVSKQRHFELHHGKYVVGEWKDSANKHLLCPRPVGAWTTPPWVRRPAEYAPQACLDAPRGWPSGDQCWTRWVSRNLQPTATRSPHRSHWGWSHRAFLNTRLYRGRGDHSRFHGVRTRFLNSDTVAAAAVGSWMFRTMVSNVLASVMKAIPLLDTSGEREQAASP